MTRYVQGNRDKNKHLRGPAQVLIFTAGALFAYGTQAYFQTSVSFSPIFFSWKTGSIPFAF